MSDPNLQALETAAPSPARAARTPRSPFGALIDGCNAAGSLLIFAVMLLICADVIARDFFNQPIRGVAEMVAISIVAIVFAQLASTLRHQRMSRAELFIDGFKLRRRRAGALLQALFDLCGLAVCAILVTATWPILASAWHENEFIGVVGVFTAPIWPVKSIVVLGSALCAAQYALFAIRGLRTALASA